MKLFAVQSNRRNGEAWAQVGGKVYKFTGTPLAADVDDKDAAELLVETGFATKQAKPVEAPKPAPKKPAKPSKEAQGDALA